jgi:hypothetical protein
MRLFLLSLTLLSLAGCISINTTRSLISLQTEFGDLVRTQANCNKTNKGDEECLADFATMYGLIESQAVAEIEELKNSTDLGDQQITIALYRLAAFASLKADTNKASDYGDAGSQLCASLADKAPPRDCALLGVVGQYEIAETFANAVTCLQTKNCTEKVNAEELANGFCATRNSLVRKSEVAKQQLLLSDSVVTYVDRQIANFDSSLATLNSHLRSGLPISDLPGQPCDCITLDPADPAFTAQCGQLQDETRMATFKAMCIRKSLKASPPSCPSY